MSSKRFATRNVALTFLVLASVGLGERPATANAPTGQYTIVSGTVFDTKTGLTWQQKTSGAYVTWADAQTYCTMNTAGLPGVGWRLPSIAELQTIVDESESNPSIDPVAFPNTVVDNYWSSSSNARAATEVWLVDFHVGYSFNLSTGTNNVNSVRCVR